MEENYDVEYENSSDQSLYNDGEDKKPKLVLIIGGIILLLIIILIFFFACSGNDNKSTNNYLTNISVANGTLMPAFEKNTLNYSISVDADFTTVSCATESSKATTEGCNKRVYLNHDCEEHIIKVTSESKEVRKYVLNICKQSKEAPIITNVKVNPSGYTNNKVTITIEATSEDGLNEKAYSFDGGRNWQASNSYTVTENTTLEIKVRDKNNNESAVLTKEINTIDKTTPSVSVKGSVESGVSTTSNVVLTAHVTPNTTSSGYKYQWYKGSTAISGATKSTYTATSSGNYKVKVTTGSGKSTTSSVFVVNKKSSGGSSSYTLVINSVSANMTSWTNKDVTLTVNAKASNGLHTTAYSFDGGKTFTSNKSKTFSKNQTVKIVVRDKKGNKTSYTSYIENIDKTKPTVSITGSATVGSTLTAKVNPASTASQYKYQWYFNNTAIGGATSSNHIPTQSGSYQVRVTTGSGNSVTSSAITVKPNVPGSVKLTGSTSSNTWTNKDVVLTATVTNGTAKSYKWYSGSTLVKTTSTGSYTVSANTSGSTYKVIVEFTNGTTATSSTHIVKIDKVKPSVPTMKYNLGSYTGSSYTSGTWTNQNVYRQIKSSDSYSGIDYFEYKNGAAGDNTCSGTSGKETLKNGTGEVKNNAYYQISYAPDSSNYACFRAVDKAGNASNLTAVQKILIDKEKPYTPIPTKQSLNCTDESGKDVSLGTNTTKDVFCGGNVASYNFGMLEKDSGGSGIDYCEGIWEAVGESSSSGCKNFGNVGQLKFIDEGTGKYKFSNVNTATWVRLNTVKICATNASQVVYLKRCYDKAGNVSKIALVWAY